ncbi:MAG: DUF2442 domain-containing protein [Lysobacterales bacterium]
MRTFASVDSDYPSTTLFAASRCTRALEFADGYLIVDLRDGRRISVPLEWYPRLAGASASALAEWTICGGGYGIHWPQLDEDLSTEGLLRGAPAPRV